MPMFGGMKSDGGLFLWWQSHFVSTDDAINSRNSAIDVLRVNILTAAAIIISRI